MREGRQGEGRGRGKRKGGGAEKGMGKGQWGQPEHSLALIESGLECGHGVIWLHTKRRRRQLLNN